MIFDSLGKMTIIFQKFCSFYRVSGLKNNLFIFINTTQFLIDPNQKVINKSLVDKYLIYL